MNSETEQSHCILDAIKDQHGTKWIKFGTAKSSVHFRLSDMHTGSAKVFEKISTTGLEVLRVKSKDAFKDNLENYAKQATYRDGMVASHPGWCGEHYILGDGRVISPGGSTSEIIVAFTGDPRCVPKGTVAAAIATLTPLVKGQSLPLSAVSMGLIGPLLRFAPANYANPLFEVVGPPASGKSGLGMLAASVCSGDEGSSSGGAETWHKTLNRIDEIRPEFADRLLVLDETNLIPEDLSTKKGAQHLSSFVFQLFQTAQKARTGDVGPPRQTRLAVLSTSNESLAELVKSDLKSRAAVLSRMVTIRVNDTRPYGIYDHIPDGFKSSEAAAERVPAACNENYAVLGEAFARVIVEQAKDPEAFKARLSVLLENAHSHLKKNGHHKRARNALALVMVAGYLAQKHDVVPREWGSFIEAVKSVQAMVTAEHARPRPTALASIVNYVRAHRDKLINISTLERPVLFEDFERSDGAFLKSNGLVKIMIPVGKFKAAFPSVHNQMLRELEAEQRLKAEEGRKVVKIPKALCREGRCYLIDITKRSSV